jgi:hypothetical protein
LTQIACPEETGGGFTIRSIRGTSMKKILLGTAFTLMAVTAANAGGHGGGGGGASSFSPGHSFQSNGPVTSGPTAGPGASGYAPGHLFQSNGSVTGSPGASGYAPGQVKR